MAGIETMRFGSALVSLPHVSLSIRPGRLAHLGMVSLLRRVGKPPRCPQAAGTWTGIQADMTAPMHSIFDRPPGRTMYSDALATAIGYPVKTGRSWRHDVKDGEWRRFLGSTFHTTDSLGINVLEPLRMVIYALILVGIEQAKPVNSRYLVLLWGDGQ